jgi:glycosyltransferase involved in cell wall biosynthesis
MVGTHVGTMGGIATVVRQYLSAGLFDRFHGVYVATHRDGTWLVKAMTALRGWSMVLWQLVLFRPALVHVHMSSRASFWRKAVVCLMADALRCPYLVHMHGSEFMRFYETEAGPRSKRFIGRILRRATLVLALSEEWSRDLSRICPDARIQVLPNAVAVPNDIDSGARAEEGDEVLFLGRIGQRKGTFDLLEAFAEIAADHPKSRLVCAGDGDVEGLRRRAQELGLQDRVTCPGWLSREETAGRLRSAALFALPSYAEGLPMALLEAMSWGLPVIATPVGGIPQVILTGENGLLVQPGDVRGLSSALSRLLGDRDLRRRLGQQALETIMTSYSLEASLSQLAGIYRRLGASERPGRSGPAALRADSWAD